MVSDQAQPVIFCDEPAKVTEEDNEIDPKKTTLKIRMTSSFIPKVFRC